MKQLFCILNSMINKIIINAVNIIKDFIINSFKKNIELTVKSCNKFYLNVAVIILY